MRFFAALLLCASSAIAFAQAVDQLSPEEIKAAIAAKPNSGFVSIMDGAFGTASACEVQMPDVDLFTPAGWVNARSQNARSQYLQFTPSAEDTGRYLRIVSHGCVNGTSAGPVCDSITRVVLLSDREGTVKVESLGDEPRPQAWHNGFGATASCSGLLSRFSMADVQKVRNSKGEFLVATFSGPTLLKIYTVKQKHLKQLGM